MKIQLERKLDACPDLMNCVVCHETFWVRSIRTLLYSDHNLIQGDVCPSCLKLKPPKFQQKLRNQANRWVYASTLAPDRYDVLQARAVELLETSEEDLTKPTILHWIFKRIQILSEENRELEVARLNNDQCGCIGQSPRLNSPSARDRLPSMEE